MKRHLELFNSLLMFSITLFHQKMLECGGYDKYEQNPTSLKITFYSLEMLQVGPKSVYRFYNLMILGSHLLQEIFSYINDFKLCLYFYFILFYPFCHFYTLTHS